MAGIKHYITTSDKLSNIAYEVGNIIYVSDIRKVIMDGPEGRTIYEQIICVSNDTIREGIVSPIIGAFYFVTQNYKLWVYDEEDQWVCINNSANDQIIFEDVSKFPDPSQASSEKLYISQNRIYRCYNGAYHLTGDGQSDAIWEEV